jgi:hypothetical protein
MRWDGYSTQLFRYYIPPDVKTVDTKFVMIKVTPEEPYSRV